jgi:hypothetical protein
MQLKNSYPICVKNITAILFLDDIIFHQDIFSQIPVITSRIFIVTFELILGIMHLKIRKEME